MKRKAAERINPYLTSQSLSRDDLKKLSPSDLGEITNLLRIKGEELSEERNRIKEKLIKEGCSQTGIEANLMHINAKIEHCHKVKKIFQDTMMERKINRTIKA